MPRITVITPVEGVSDTKLYVAEGKPGPRFAIVARMHGNEPVGDGVLERFAAEVEARLLCGSVLTVRANTVAAGENVRHTSDGVDLNRQWDRDTLRRNAAADPSTLCYEERRARELAPLLLSADVLIDLHSTSRPSHPHLVFRDDQQHALIARRLGVRHLVTGVHENGVLNGGICSTIGLGPGESSDRVGFTFEAGEHHNPENADRAWAVTQRLLGYFNAWADAPPVESGLDFEVYEVIDRFRQAPSGAVQYRFVGYEGGEAGDRRWGAPRQLHSFEEVQADEVVLRRGHQGVVRASTPFTMLMPAPHTAPGTDLYYVTQPRRGGLTDGVERTDAEARREALAIERMLDLLADDEFATGATWIAFDSRRLFDQCASIVARNLHLPPDDPNRGITIVGRGSAAADDGERRAGQRYRQALRTAISAGLPVSRYQVMRGATLGWFDSLCSSSTADLLRERATSFPRAPAVRLGVSTRQPRTISLLTAGDVVRALRTGENRHVRVAIAIEAATVEPDVGTARVRVVRTALISSRPEVLEVAHRLTEALRYEHAGLVRDAEAFGDLAPFVDDSGLFATAPSRQAAIRDVLVRNQLSVWLRALTLEVTERRILRTPEEVGQWLAQTMSATGILDANALHGLLLRREQGRWLVMPERLADLAHAVATGRPISQAETVRPSSSPPQPLFADQVTKDDLERWVGWKRFVRGVRRVPDTRGKDLDLAFDPRVIRERIIEWLGTARSLAAANPDRVMLIAVGDGLNPTREPSRDAWELIAAHTGAVGDRHLRYVRVLHGRGVHVGWLKDLAKVAAGRGRDAASVSLQWEPEHAAAVQLLVIAVQDEGAPPATAFSLDGWRLSHVAVLLQDLRGTGNQPYPVGLFTEYLAGHADVINHELVHFARTHCEDLFAQSGPRVHAERGAAPPEAVAVAHAALLSRWVEEVRRWVADHSDVAVTSDAVLHHVVGQMGISDPAVAWMLVDAISEEKPAAQFVREMWDGAAAWPGEPQEVRVGN